MLIKGIDYSKCIDCGNCVNVCPTRLYLETSEKKEEYYFEDPYKLCVRCGHCIAVCPTNAIIYAKAEKPFELENKDILEEIVTYEDLMKIIRMRRSIRNFKEQEIPKDKIEKVLEAIRYAPTASNRQNWRFCVITDKKEIEYLSRETSRFYKMAKRLLPLKWLIAPFLSRGGRRRVLKKKTKVQLEKAMKRIKNGEDLVFFNAPCVIILYSRPYVNNLAANDAGIALTQGMLAAQSLGLGTCWIGFAQRRLQNKRKLRKHFNIPKGFTIFGVIAMGFPSIKYNRGPPRRKLRVNWIE